MNKEIEKIFKAHQCLGLCTPIALDEAFALGQEMMLEEVKKEIDRIKFPSENVEHLRGFRDCMFELKQRLENLNNSNFAGVAENQIGAVESAQVGSSKSLPSSEDPNLKIDSKENLV